MKNQLKTLKKGLTSVRAYNAYTVKIQKDENGRLYLKYYRDGVEVDTYGNNAFYIDCLIEAAKAWCLQKGYTTNFWSY